MIILSISPTLLVHSHKIIEMVCDAALFYFGIFIERQRERDRKEMEILQRLVYYGNGGG